MPLLGREGTEGVNVALTPKLLVRLARDLLVARGHRFVRQTDGPGDGGRDVHSLARDGRKHLAQCKHHDDASHACSSDEVSELPMALVKFGIPQGLFVTDARISPQAKREYLGDYPSLALEFLDREELIGEVLASAVLRALWFDGGRLGLVNARTIFPLLVRRHDGDQPLLPLRHLALRERISEAVRAEAQPRGLSVEFREVPSDRSPFERYRLPHRLTYDEGFQGDLITTEIGFKGGVALHELQSLSRALALKLSEAVAAEFDAATVVVGRAFITPLEGDEAGLRTLTRATRTSAVAVGSSATLEERWFLPDDAGEWDSTCDARATEVEWVRLYHRRLDMAVAYEIATTAAPIDLLVRQTTRLGWSKSVFALLPRWDTWEYAQVPEPDERIAWPFEEGRILCGWLHPLTGDALYRVPRDEGDESPTFPALDEAAADHAMSATRDLVSRLSGIEMVDPVRARHMLGVLSHDPLGADDAPALFRTGEVLAAFSGLASPIDPLARRAEITVAWRASACDQRAVEAEGDGLARCLGGAATVDRDEDFVVLSIQVPALPIRVSTSEWLSKVAENFEPALARIDATGGSTEMRATAEYWAAAHGVRLGVAWHQSEKTYLWAHGADGLAPIKVSLEEIEPDE